MNKIQRFWRWLREPLPNRNMPEKNEDYFNLMDDILYSGRYQAIGPFKKYNDKVIDLILAATVAACFFLLGCAFVLMVQGTT